MTLSFMTELLSEAADLRAVVACGEIRIEEQKVAAKSTRTTPYSKTADDAKESIYNLAAASKV
jgi:hypothetical protein